MSQCVIGIEGNQPVVNEIQGETLSTDIHYRSSAILQLHSNIDEMRQQDAACRVKT